MRNAASDTRLLKLDQNERSDDMPNWVKPFFDRLEDPIFWRYPQKVKAESAWAQHLGLNAEQVLLTNGSDEAISLLFSTLEPETKVILPLPAFGVFTDQCNRWPVEAVFIPALQDLSIDKKAVQKKLERVQGGLFIITRPNNPTGECIPIDLLLSWITLAEENQTLVLLDEAYAEFLEIDPSEETCLPYLNQFPNLLIIKTLSKAYGLAGFRIGILLGAPTTLDPIRRRVMPFNLSSPSVELAIEALNPLVQKDVSQYCQKIRENRERLFDTLCGWGISVFPGKGNFLLLRLASPRNQLVANFLKSCGIAVRLFNRAELKDTLRITIPTEMSSLIPLLKQVLFPELICLDVDGCLMDVSTSFDLAIKRTVLHFTGVPASQDEIEILRMKTGFNNDFSLSQELIKRRNTTISIEEVTSIFEACYWGTENSGPRENDPIETGTQKNEEPFVTVETMDFLMQNYKTALVTGRNRRELKPLFKHAVFRQPIFPVTADDVKRGKPDPEGIVQAQSHFETIDSWMVGDNVDDISAAIASGSVPIGISKNPDRLTKAGACIVLENINEIRSLLS